MTECLLSSQWGGLSLGFSKVLRTLVSCILVEHLRDVEKVVIGAYSLSIARVCAFSPGLFVQARGGGGGGGGGSLLKKKKEVPCSYTLDRFFVRSTSSANPRSQEQTPLRNSTTLTSGGESITPASVSHKSTANQPIAHVDGKRSSLLGVDRDSRLFAGAETANGLKHGAAEGADGIGGVRRPLERHKDSSAEPVTHLGNGTKSTGTGDKGEGSVQEVAAPLRRGGNYAEHAADGAAPGNGVSDGYGGGQCGGKESGKAPDCPALLAHKSRNLGLESGAKVASPKRKSVGGLRPQLETSALTKSEQPCDAFQNQVYQSVRGQKRARKTPTAGFLLSQEDDEAPEVVWKYSPTVDRLNASAACAAVSAGGVDSARRQLGNTAKSVDGGDLERAAEFGSKTAKDKDEVGRRDKRRQWRASYRTEDDLTKKELEEGEGREEEVGAQKRPQSSHSIVEDIVLKVSSLHSGNSAFSSPSQKVPSTKSLLEKWLFKSSGEDGVDDKLSAELKATETADISAAKDQGTAYLSPPDNGSTKRTSLQKSKRRRSLGSSVKDKSGSSKRGRKEQGKSVVRRVQRRKALLDLLDQVEGAVSTSRSRQKQKGQTLPKPSSEEHEEHDRKSLCHVDSTNKDGLKEAEDGRRGDEHGEHGVHCDRSDDGSKRANGENGQSAVTDSDLPAVVPAEETQMKDTGIAERHSPCKENIVAVPNTSQDKLPSLAGKVSALGTTAALDLFSDFDWEKAVSEGAFDILERGKLCDICHERGCSCTTASANGFAGGTASKEVHERAPGGGMHGVAGEAAIWRGGEANTEAYDVHCREKSQATTVTRAKKQQICHIEKEIRVFAEESGDKEKRICLLEKASAVGGSGMREKNGDECGSHAGAQNISSTRTVGNGVPARTTRGTIGLQPCCSKSGETREEKLDADDDDGTTSAIQRQNGQAVRECSGSARIEDNADKQGTLRAGIESTAKPEIASGNNNELLGVDESEGENKQMLKNGQTDFKVLEVIDSDYPSEGSQHLRSQKVLRVVAEDHCEGDLEKFICLRDEWIYSTVEVGDLVNVVGEFAPREDAPGVSECVVDREKNLLILHPYVLISGSRVGASFGCARRVVLDERLKSVETSGPALMGTMLHELFQFALRKEGCTHGLLQEEARRIINNHIEGLYAIREDELGALEKICSSIPQILHWKQKFLSPEPKPEGVVCFSREKRANLCVAEVTDIEENVWAPKYGLKGMIDASVLVRSHSSNYPQPVETSVQVMPLELKTGRCTTGQAAIEHQGQVILYTLLMSERYEQKVDKGLLYYMHTGEMQNSRVCEKCHQVDACTVYHKAREEGNEETSGLKGIFLMKTEHITAAHADFLKKWERLVDLEGQDAQTLRADIWKKSSWAREKSGQCISSLLLDSCHMRAPKVPGGNNGYVYKFSHDKCHSMNISIATKAKEKAEEGSGEVIQRAEGRMRGVDEGCRQGAGGLLDLPFVEGDFVVLSTESGQVNLGHGVITAISRDSIEVSFQRKLRIPGKVLDNPVERSQSLRWRLDKDDISSMLSLMSLGFRVSPKTSYPHEKPNNFPYTTEAPRFDDVESDLAASTQIGVLNYLKGVKELNQGQRQAILKILGARDYALILGMPGTGKTTTIVHLVMALLACGKSILLSSYTNSAVDNILIKLRSKGVDFLRVGRQDATHPLVQDYALNAPGREIKSVRRMAETVQEARVVGVTCLGISHPMFLKRTFDVCIVDEASQIMLPVCLGPLRCCEKFVLVGDHNQLPPLVRSMEAKEGGLADSLFRLLSESHPEAVATLDCQYRMSEDIMLLSNKLVYDMRLRCGSPDVAKAMLHLPAWQASGQFEFAPWLNEVLKPERRVVFLNTDAIDSARESRMGDALHNVGEAIILLQIAKTLVSCGVTAVSIGAICPYQAQVRLLSRMSTNEGLPDMEVHTVDKYQGRDKDCVLVSFVRSNGAARKAGSLLADWRRVNVALTRAKKKLIMIGSRMTLSSVPVLCKLIELVDGEGWLMEMPADALQQIEAGGPANLSELGKGNTGRESSRLSLSLRARNGQSRTHALGSDNTAGAGARAGAAEADRSNNSSRQDEPIRRFQPSGLERLVSGWDSKTAERRTVLTSLSENIMAHVEGL
ncbi:hypothetical protein CBR_g41486 [Chara braunii]|uniref:DNA replication ATP-dependent helicase/nuclease DNA2 n=1 Tax=Chara braunii TaxID=69332 RepID=A0A388LW96_CHABU|nr:hypothetical protein CBR_g41486 [Chara braunii]|eukprot:GBG86492.1 hypothetical protein CBR_g41486 [Chara braunii]